MRSFAPQPPPGPDRRLPAAPWLALPRSPRKRPSFQLDWRFEGPARDVPRPRGQGLLQEGEAAVTIDAGNGSGGTVTRVASGAYDMALPTSPR